MLEQAREDIRSGEQSKRQCELELEEVENWLGFYRGGEELEKVKEWVGGIGRKKLEK